MGTFQVLFSGDLARGADQATVLDRLAEALGVDRNKARQLFQGRTVVIRSNLSERDALDLQHRLFDLGAVCRVKDTAQPYRAGPPAMLDHDVARMEPKREEILREITAAYVECPSCAHVQLDTSHCARCGVDMLKAAARRRREDLLIEQQLRELRARRTEQIRTGVLASDGPPLVRPGDFRARRRSGQPH
ncbi:MAG: hypothetical protein KF911_02070 [Pseudomonadales bacterium]|nr:hypothetical protein [Pseudomonadales bacterium]